MQDLITLQGFDVYKLDLDNMVYKQMNTLAGTNRGGGRRWAVNIWIFLGPSQVMRLGCPQEKCKTPSDLFVSQDLWTKTLQIPSTAKIGVSVSLFHCF